VGLPGILSIQPQYMGYFGICMAIAVVVPFVLTLAIGKKKGIGTDREVANGLDMSAAADQIFAAGKK
jgi:PTS system trehalose-specific IIC component